ncbi:methyltransferase family protein [Desulfobacter curvatus]|uniref:methyltransferase family protein n=1 Tax=Desulfobacter curvatus TaxID=2290 RepID=UPI0003829BD7|nr:isoprenylcysteine carboxylmethyltransferase family protein [Desulfobacter curvatus]
MNFILFMLISLILVWISRHTLKNYRSHGFYRFFAFEGIAALLALNQPYWFNDPFSMRQIIAWTLLICSIGFVLFAVKRLRALGGHCRRDDMPENFNFENTTHLVDSGLYRFIRHPMYTSLLLLNWGAFLKHITPVTLGISVITTLFLIATAKVEEKENQTVFGEAYTEYCSKSKMFIPFLF